MVSISEVTIQKSRREVNVFTVCLETSENQIKATCEGG